MIVSRNEGLPGMKTAFLFSCPGQEEMKSGRLVNGQTGKNLDRLLCFLHEQRPDLFPETNRYAYRITNSSEQVHFKAHDGRTEPSEKEIALPENLSRLKEDLRGFELVITFGRCASFAAQRLSDDKTAPLPRFISCRHLSFLSLNSSIKTDVHGSPILRNDPQATDKRLMVVAGQVLSQL